jgi:AraC family transcriptional regulator, regulatory protein of adaptative response / methylated-DNA-[protein]-cysteine methyltransferase
MLHTLEPATEQESTRYARIARAIQYLSETYARQPSLEDAARVAQLSPFHFQREFRELAGISPKGFVAALTLEQAKSGLDAGARVLDAALDAGLSGASRLHDLCLKIEAMTPGEYAKGGAGLTIAYGYHPSLFGFALIMATERGLCGLGFGDPGEEETMLADMRSRWGKARFIHDRLATSNYAQRIFARDKAGKNALPIQLFGTPWQIKVWQALLAIPQGKVATYRSIAERVCSVRASRAVGAAIGRNPIALLIPCHRVLASSGALTGYHWGINRKRALLAYEAVRCRAPDS